MARHARQHITDPEFPGPMGRADKIRSPSRAGKRSRVRCRSCSDHSWARASTDRRPAMRARSTSRARPQRGAGARSSPRKIQSDDARRARRDRERQRAGPAARSSTRVVAVSGVSSMARRENGAMTALASAAWPSATRSQGSALARGPFSRHTRRVLASVHPLHAAIERVIADFPGRRGAQKCRPSCDS